MKKKDNKEWLRLDNAARIYPAIMSKRITTMFRIAAVLKYDVDVDYLKSSVAALSHRFPYYQVSLQSGFFWEYLEESHEPILAHKERLPPCQLPRRKERGYLFRILYYKRRITVEFSHILTDGTGALEFLKAILFEYFSQQGFRLNWPEVMKKEDAIEPEEFEDSYKRYFKAGLPKPEKKDIAYKLDFPLLPAGQYRITTGIIPIKKCLQLCKSMNVSLTEWLTAIYMQSLIRHMQEYQQVKKPVRILIPVNLRKIFPSQTMRNFFLAIMPEIDPRLGEYALDEMCKQIYHFMRSHLDEKQIARQITRNVSGERHPFIKYVPLVVKQLMGPAVYNMLSSNQHSGTFSNLGAIRLPDNMTDHVDRFEFILNPNPSTKTNLTAISFKESLYLTFSSQIENRSLESKFFQYLRSLNLPLTMETNY